jgi:rubrerythrin
MHPIATVEEFYAHALAIELEATERYDEFARHLADRGEDVMAGLCRNLAEGERGHYASLVAASAHLALPAIAAGEHHWIESGASETPARELLYRVATPRQLLEVALDAEQRARAFFVQVVHTSPSEEIRQIAAIMAAEELEHVQWVRQALEYHSAA